MDTTQNIPTRKLLVSGLLIAALFDILLYGSIFKIIPFGLNVPLFIAAFYLVMAYALKGRLSFRRFPLHIVFIALFSTAFALYNNAALLIIDALLLIVLIGEHMMLSLSQNEYDPWSVFVIGDSMTFWFGYSFGGVRGAYRQYGEKEHVRGLKGVLIGVAISLPAAVVVLLLLQSADAAFGKLVDDIFGDIHWNDIFGYSLAGLALFTLGSGLIWFAAKGREEKAAPVATAQRPFVFNSTAALILCATLDLILAVFSITQFMYLFAGRMPEGYTYAEYARTGFYQLLGVSAIVLLFIFLIVKFSDSGQKHRTAKRILLTLLCAFTLILLVSAFARMVLYEQAYNFTVFRIFTQFFMVALGIILVWTALYVWLPQLPIRKLVFVTGLACYAALAMMNLDGFIARENVKYQGHKVDIAYLATLSCDAMPYYVDIADRWRQYVRYEDYTWETREAVPIGDEYVLYDDEEYIAVAFPNYTTYSVFMNLDEQRRWLEKSDSWQYLNMGRTEARPLLTEYPDLFDTAQYIAEHTNYWW